MRGWIAVVVIVLAVLLVSGCTEMTQFGSVFQAKQKPSYYCEKSNSSCMARANEDRTNCNEVIITIDNTLYTYSIDITQMGNTCRMVQTMVYSAISGLKGKSMTCDIPMSKVSQAVGLTSYQLIKYCEGPLKDDLMRKTEQMFS